MKVLQIGKYYGLSGGIERVVYSLQSGSIEQNTNMTNDVISIHYKKHKSEEITVASHATIYVEKSLVKVASTAISINFIVKLKKIIANYDIIHLHHPNPMGTLALFLVGLTSRQKLMVHWHSDIIKQKTLFTFFKPLQDWLLKRADVIVGTSEKYIKHSEHLHPYLNKSIAIPIGIDGFNKANNSFLKERYHGKKIIFSLGRLCYYKGFDTLIESASYLPDNYLILIGGEGELEKKLQAKINALSLGKKVKLIGRISNVELPHYFSFCDIYCMSSIEKSEAFGVVLIEAFSLGKPVVATNIPGSGVDWVNQHDITGYNVSPANALELAETIIRICSDKEKYAVFSENAKNRFEKYFRKVNMVKSFVDLYEKLYKY